MFHTYRCIACMCRNAFTIQVHSVHERFFTTSDILTTVFNQHRIFLWAGEQKWSTWILKVKMSPSPSEGMKIWVRPSDPNSTISASNPINNLNCVFISYLPQKWFDLVVNYNKNIVLLIKYWQKWLPGLTSATNLTILRVVKLSHMRKRAEMSSLHVNNGALTFFQHCSPQKWLISPTF